MTTPPAGTSPPTMARLILGPVGLAALVLGACSSTPSEPATTRNEPASTPPGPANQAPAPSEPARPAGEPLDWNGLELGEFRAWYTHHNRHLVYFEAPLAETMADLEERFVAAAVRKGWEQGERVEGLTDTDREVLADPEIDEGMKAAWANPHKVNVDFYRGSDKLVLFIEKEDEAWEIEFMLIPDVEALQAELEAVQPCLRVRLCCRAVDDCDFERMKTVTEPDACQAELDQLLARLESGGDELPLQCQFE
jgi:hypothetical protein